MKTLFAVFIAVSVMACSVHAASRPNVLLICVDDLRPELNCFGVSYVHSPNMDRLASRGRIFRRHYVQAPTCGASRYTLLTGRYGGAGNHALFERASRERAEPGSQSPTMPTWFRQHGYTTVSVGKVSHHPGGKGGEDWDDAATLEMPDAWDRHLLPVGSWQHPRGWMHGLARGEIRLKAGDMELFQAVDGPDTLYPDGISVEEALGQMDQLASNPDAPFFLAVGLLRPHLPFGVPARYLKLYEGVELPPTPHPVKPTGRTTWHGSGEFMKYKRWKRNPNEDAAFALEVRQHYAACVSYADAQVGRLMERLDQLELSDDTIVVLWGDHGWHLGEHAIWGKHALFEESLRSPLMIAYAGIPERGTPTDSMVETLDLFPTLCELAGLPVPGFVQGRSLVPLLKNPGAPGHSAIAYSRKARTIRSKDYRLILHEDGYAELYDHRSPQRETVNVAADQHAQVLQLRRQLLARLPWAIFDH
ncbi:MAG: sulfatase [Verrucomicrobiota bacterium]|jgi:iduronate 2-sulfatase|nr:sulfatase [Verrucomicrobiota bacterium]